jgi:hypothetical protein
VYLSFWASTNLYRLTGDISRPYRWSTADLCAAEIPRDIAEVFLSDLYGYWRTRLFLVLVTLEDKFCPQILVILYCLGGIVFPLGFLMTTYRT